MYISGQRTKFGKLRRKKDIKSFRISELKIKIFFANENIKNRPQKLLIIGIKLFLQYCPAAQTSPELIFQNHT